MCVCLKPPCGLCCGLGCVGVGCHSRRCAVFNVKNAHLTNYWLRRGQCNYKFFVTYILQLTYGLAVIIMAIIRQSSCLFQSYHLMSKRRLHDRMSQESKQGEQAPQAAILSISPYPHTGSAKVSYQRKVARYMKNYLMVFSNWEQRRWLIRLAATKSNEVLF